MADNELPEEVYGVFCGAINQDSARNISHNLSIASKGGVKRVHLLFQSTGGSVNEGIFLYHLFKSLTFELILYNGGQVSSIAAVSYLGAQTRKTSAGAVFLLHKSTNTAQAATASTMNILGKALTLDDERTESILRSHVTLPNDLWETHKYQDIYLSASDAVSFGLAQVIGDFNIPPGAKLFAV